MPGYRVFRGSHTVLVTDLYRGFFRWWSKHARTSQFIPVELKGTARPADDRAIVESPVTSTDSLATSITVQEWESSKHGGSWETVYEETNTIPFLIDDGTGEIGVEFPLEGQLNVDRVRITVKSGDAPSEPIRQFIEQGTDIGDATRDDLSLLSVGGRDNTPRA